MDRGSEHAGQGQGQQTGLDVDGGVREVEVEVGVLEFKNVVSTVYGGYVCAEAYVSSPHGVDFETEDGFQVFVADVVEVHAGALIDDVVVAIGRVGVMVIQVLGELGVHVQVEARFQFGGGGAGGNAEKHCGQKGHESKTFHFLSPFALKNI